MGDTMRLFVRGGDQYTSLSEIVSLFEGCGEVLDARMRQSVKGKYFLLTMWYCDAERAIKRFDGDNWNDQRLTVQESIW
jgi:hypothetical protein